LNCFNVGKKDPITGNPTNKSVIKNKICDGVKVKMGHESSADKKKQKAGGKGKDAKKEKFSLLVHD
jgi:hypothetical protein